MKTTLAAALCAAVLLAGSVPAFAADTARASGTISIYAGPGQDYRVIGKLKKDTRVELQRCTARGTWCLFKDSSGRPAGWVRASYLVGIGAITKATPFHFLSNPQMVQVPAK